MFFFFAKKTETFFYPCEVVVFYQIILFFVLKTLFNYLKLNGKIMSRIDCINNFLE